MELFQTDLHYILLDGDYSLWCNRTNGRLEPKKGSELANAWNPVCVGHVFGIIGKVKLHPESEWRLLLIKHRTPVWQLAGKHTIYRIDKMVALPLNATEACPELDLELCKKHHFGIKSTDRINQAAEAQGQKSLRGTWNQIKTAAENVKSKKKETKDKEKFEKRIMEELLKMFNDSEFFYYSEDFDLTTSLQKQNSPEYDQDATLWRRADTRFFWNRHMLAELIDLDDPLAAHWILPVIQGYVQMETCLMDFEEDKMAADMSSSGEFSLPSGPKLDPLSYNISIVSRRSCHRAGTRSRKRGIDSDGACANYVETEQIIEFSPHIVSFVQVRGSIPVFWSQSGFKYRPPPRLDRDETASHEAFVKHMDEQLALYNKVAIISLAELAGKEHVIGDAFLAHVLEYNSPEVIYVTFDFHEYCRGMRFENVSILTDGIKDIIKDMRYTWLDTKGAICEQRGVFRVNCVDCLDRTNVVQTAVARIVMETQFRKLGLLPPEESLPSSCRKIYQQIWANNGDVISRQYAGTAALKGDYTRTGERKFSGLMKDGVNSANRYYLRFRDAYCQAAIDLSLGQPVSPALLAPTLDITDAIDERDEGDEEDEAREREENARTMIEDCKRMLIVEPEHCLGAWGLVNATPGESDSDQVDMDMILLLSQRSVYVCWYDDDLEQVTRYQRIYLEDVDKIEIGMEPAVFKSKHQVLRLTYHHQAEEGLYHMFRVPSTRLFNNKVTAVQSAEEIKESLRLVADTFRGAQEIMSIQLEIVEKTKLDRRKAGPHPEVMDIHQQQQENSLACIQLPRDVSTELHPNYSTPGPNHLQPSADSTPSARPKSPLQYISSLPKQSIVSALSRVGKGAGEGGVSKSSTTSASRFSLPKPNLRVSFQNMGVMRRIKDVSLTSRAVRFTRSVGGVFPTDESGDQYDSGIDVPDGEAVIESEQHTEVVMDGCGILASSPKQVLLSSIQLQTEGKHRMSQSESPLSHSPVIVGGTEKTTSSAFGPPAENFVYPEAQCEELSRDLKYNKSHVEGDGSAGIAILPGSDEGREDHIPVGTEVSQNDEDTTEVNADSQREGSENGDGLDDDREDAFCVIETKNMHDILSRCHQLHHPLMKTSHSDTSLSAMAGGMVDVTATPDAGLMSRLKLKMTNLSRPLAGGSGFTSYATPQGKGEDGNAGAPSDVPVHTKTHIRKSQRAMDVFEKLLKEKLPTMECKSRFIFI